MLVKADDNKFKNEKTPDAARRLGFCDLHLFRSHNMGRVTDLDGIRYKKAAENLRATVIFALSAPIDLGLLLLHVL